MALIEEIEQYWTLRSNGFSAAVNEELVDRGNVICEELVRLTGIRKGSKVLDLGCGPGLFSVLLAKYGAEVIGIDYSSGMVEKAKTNAEAEGVTAEFLKMDAQKLEFGDNVFDAVVSRNVFWALEKPQECYSEIIRVLKPGCKGLVIDGNYYLRLYNEDYAFRPVPSKELAHRDGHTCHNTDNVDFKIIEDLAKDLPLSRNERPPWDVEILCKLGCTDIQILLPPDNGRIDRSKIIPMFKIIFSKA